MSVVAHAATTHHQEWGGRARYIRIVLHDTLPELRTAAKKYRAADFASAGGVFHPAVSRSRFDGEAWVDTTPAGWAGLMRLSRDYLHPEVVAHECVHAGLAIYRMDIAREADLGDDCGEKEETLAYIVGDLISQVTDTLHEMGAWAS